MTAQWFTSEDKANLQAILASWEADEIAHRKNGIETLEGFDLDIDLRALAAKVDTADQLIVRPKTSIKQATERWVSQFGAIPQALFERAFEDAADIGMSEITKPKVGDRVYCYEEDEYGEIRQIPSDEDELKPYLVQLDSDDVGALSKVADLQVDRDILPIWGTMWQFGESPDNWWLEEGGGLQAMSECGFRIYEHAEFGHFFGIDGAGHDFYEAHWIPLYLERGLQWHDSEPSADQVQALEVAVPALDEIGKEVTLAASRLSDLSQPVHVKESKEL